MQDQEHNYREVPNIAWYSDSDVSNSRVHTADSQPLCGWKFTFNTFYNWSGQAEHKDNVGKVR